MTAPPPSAAVAPAAALREFLLAVERTKQPLDDAIETFAQALAADTTEQLAHKFLDIQPHADAFLHAWPDQHGAGTRWNKRESIATFFRVLATLLRVQTQRNAGAAEVLALRVVREKHALLEKVLAWSDKPIIEFEALELMTTLVRVNGAVAREFVRLFNFQSKSFVKIATRRLKKPEQPVAVPTDNNSDSDADVDAAPLLPPPIQPAFQIREAYVQLVLALTACPDKSVHRFAMKDGGVTASLFKSIDGDSVALLAHMFAQLNALVLHNPHVDYKTKLVIFNAHCVHQVLPLLQSDDDAIARMALDVLHALFFASDALYVVPPRLALRLFLSKASGSAAVVSSSNSTDATTDSDSVGSHASEVAYAVRVIRNAIVTLGVNELIRSVHAQTLVTSFLTRYPGLAAEYLQSLSIQLEPKPGYRWFCMASLVQKLLACSLAAATPGLLFQSSTDRASWCSSTLLATRLVLPLNCRKELSRGIQHANNLVVYSSLGVLEAALRRFQFLASLASCINPTELATELRFLVPSPEALVSLLLKLCASVDTTALIYVRALVVFRLYLECLPQAMREVKLDFTKILAWQFLDTGALASTTAPLGSLIASEILRFLLAVDASRLHVLLPSSSATGNHVPAPRSKLQQLLQLFVTSTNATIQSLSMQVLQRTLLVSTVFGNDDAAASSSTSSRVHEETRIWLDALRVGGATCAAFTEALVQHVLADPFRYLETFHRTQATTAAADDNSRAALCLSPGAIALVTFFQTSSAPVEESATTSSNNNNASAALAAFRTNADVVVFGTRVLLALLGVADAPQQLVALITSRDSVDAVARGSDVADDAVDASSGAAKKRKRANPTPNAVDNDATLTSSDAFTLLAQYCRSLASTSTRAPVTPTPTKKSKTTHAEASWRNAPTLRRFTQQLFALPRSTFVASWKSIVANCIDLTDSLELVFHYLGSWVSGDLVSVFQHHRASFDHPAASSSSKKKTKHTATLSSGAVAAGASERFLRELPLPTLLQSVVLDTSAPSEAAIEAVAAEFTQRMRTGALTFAAAALVCEQLLFALRYSRFTSNSSSSSSADRLDAALCRLLLQALSFAVAAAKSAASPAVDNQVARILRKLHDAANAAARSASASLLARKLSALEVVGLGLLHSSSSTCVHTTAAVATRFDPSSLAHLLQRAGVPTVVLLAPLCAVDVRVQLLETFLRAGLRRALTSSVDGVLLQHVLQSLDRDVDATHATFAAYPQRTRLARKLWQLLERASLSTHASSSNSLTTFYASSFSVLGKLGGVSLPIAHTALDATFVPIITGAAQATTGVSLADVLRRIVLAIDSTNATEPPATTTHNGVAFAQDLQSALAAALETANKEATHALLCAVFDVFTRIESPALRARADALVPDSVEHVLLGGRSGGMNDDATQLAFLRHALLASSASTERLASAVASSVKRLAKQHPDGTLLSTTQQTALLLVLRAQLHTTAAASSQATQETTIVFLVKCGLQALKAATKASADAALARRANQLVAVVTTVVTDVASNLTPATRRAIVKALGPQFTRAQELNVSASIAAFALFAKLTCVFLQLVGVAGDADADATASITYDFGDHLAALTDSPRFVECLERHTSGAVAVAGVAIDDDDAARVALVRAVYWLVQLSNVYDRKLFRTLLSVYAMSLSPLDRLLRLLFESFDARAGISLAQVGFRFGASSTTILLAADDAATASGPARTDLVDDSVWLLSGGLEQARMRATVEHFPLDREVATTDDRALLAFALDACDANDADTASGARDGVQAYDPAFLLPMLAHFISSSDLPDAAIVQQGLLGLAVRATSSNAACMRSYAFGVVAHVHESLAAESAEFKAGRQIHLLLESLRHAIDAPLASVSSIVTVFLNDAISILCRPVHAMYPHINHFLLARPAIDIHDVPMFYSLFNSRAPLTYKQERSWFLHTLRRGVCEDADVQLLVRRHVLPILLSFFGSELADEHTQRLVAQILTQCLATDAGASYLLTKASLVEWISALVLKHSSTGATAGTAGSSNSKTLVLLMDLLERALQASKTLEIDLDTAQQHALALQVMNAFAALDASVQTAHARPEVLTTLARTAALVLRVAQSASSLATITTVVRTVAHAAATAAATQNDERVDEHASMRDGTSTAVTTTTMDASTVLSCMEAIVSDRLLDHPDLHARTFSEWASVLSTIADVVAAMLATEEAPSSATAKRMALPASSVALRARATTLLRDLKRVLVRVPALKQRVLVRAAHTRIAYAALL